MVARLRKAFRMQLLPLAVCFGVLALVVGGRSWLVETQSSYNEAVRAAFELDQRFLRTLSLVQDAETGQRGFLLTGENAYLDPYRASVGAIPVEIAAIRTALAGDATRTAQLDKLASEIDEKLAELAGTIELRRTAGLDAAVATVKENVGKQTMDRIRATLRVMQSDANKVLQERLRRSEQADQWLRWASIVALAAVFFTAGYTLYDARRRIAAVIASQNELSRTNRALFEEAESRQKAEAQVRQMQKMEAVGQLTGGIAHDFNNMLAVIMSAMNLMQRKLARGETDLQKFVEAATDAAQRAAALTARLLAFSRQQPLAPQVIDANRMVTGMSDMLRRTLGETVQIETVLAGGLWRAYADASQLENAILNLAVNGRDAMPDGGKLTIETANSHLDEAYAAAHEEVAAGQYVMVAVTDTGTGMPAEVVARAFDPFFTTKPVNKGTGLGLSQVFGFVKQSGGHVKIYSEPGEGTTVKIYLKRHIGEEQVAAMPIAQADPASRPTEKVLVVEDDARVRTSTVESMRELGYTVIHAGDAAEALRKLDEQPDVALLFTDIIMPVKNGRKLAEEAVAKLPGLKVIFTTGFTKNAVVHNGVLDPGVHFLAKPFTLDQLGAKLREVLDG